MTPLAIFQLISAIGPIVIAALQGNGVINTKFGSLITAIETAITQFGTMISNAPNGQLNVSAISILTGISAAVSILQSETNLDPSVLALINAFDKAVTAGLTAYENAGKLVDVTTLQPIALAA